MENVVKKYFSEEYLDALLAGEGLNPDEVETFISLAQSAHSGKSLFTSGIYESMREVRTAVQGLMRRGLIRRMKTVRGELYVLPEWSTTRHSFSSSRRKDKILKKIKGMTLHPEREMYGMSINPALGPRVPQVNSRRDFQFLHARYKSILPKIEIRAMSKCNINCIYCYYQKGFDVPPDENLRHELHKARKLGVNNVTVNGGEFTIRKDNLKVLDAMSGAGFEDIELFTNGLMFYRDDLLKAFIERGVTSVFLHVSAVEEKMYERLARTKGSHAALLEALKNLQKYPDISLTVFTVVNKINLKQLKNIAAFFQDFNSKVKFKNFFHYFGNYCVYSSTSNAWEMRKKVMPEMTETAHYVREALDAVKNGSPGALYGRIPFCLMKGYEAYNYDLYMTMSKFSLNGEDRSEQSQTAFAETVFTKKPSCRECIHDRYCPGVMKGYAKTYGLDEFQPVKAPPVEQGAART